MGTFGGSESAYSNLDAYLEKIIAYPPTLTTILVDC